LAGGEEGKFCDTHRRIVGGLRAVAVKIGNSASKEFAGVTCGRAVFDRDLRGRRVGEGSGTPGDLAYPFWIRGTAVPYKLKSINLAFPDFLQITITSGSYNL